MMNYNHNPYQQAPTPYQQAAMPNYPNQYPQYPGYYPPVPGGYYQPAPQEQQPESGWKKVGRFGLDLLKIGIAVAGGVAVYRLAENYFGDDPAPTITTTDTAAAAILGGAEDIE